MSARMNDAEGSVPWAQPLTLVARSRLFLYFRFGAGREDCIFIALDYVTAPLARVSRAFVHRLVANKSLVAFTALSADRPYILRTDRDYFLAACVTE